MNSRGAASMFSLAMAAQQADERGRVKRCPASVGIQGKKNPLHGFRATARTILDEVLQQRVDHVEHQLAHSVRDPLGWAYNRTSHLDERRKMMQLWADYMDGLKQGAKVVPIKQDVVDGRGRPQPKLTSIKLDPLRGRRNFLENES